MIALAPDKITKRHRERDAYVYVRQSTLKQVHQNQESQLNQYALVQRAIASFVGYPSGSTSSTVIWGSQDKIVSVLDSKVWLPLFRLGKLV